MARTVKDLTESAFQQLIIDKLVDSGYETGSNNDYNKDVAIDTEKLFRFLDNSQPKTIEALKERYGGVYKEKVLERLNRELDQYGMIDVLRYGIRDLGIKIELAYFKPVSTRSTELFELYDKNILSVTQELVYTERTESTDNKNRLDLVIFLNGLPIMVIELKTQTTRQTARFHGQKQYREDRDPKELIFKFKKWALVFFTMDCDEIYMASKLSGSKTFFLPFNKGNEGGAGNPLVENGIRTHYMYDEILQKDSLMDIIKRYYFIDIEEKKDRKGNVIKKETAVFPRYHQLDVNRKIEKDVEKNGVGQNYLIQHSAGSGKTYSISWLAHRLANIHIGENNVFDSIVVLTDRTNLDMQLQDTIYQMDHKHGVVAPIKENSTELAEAIKKGTKIIISTIQKFPFVLNKIDELSEKKYAIIIDEAHSSTAGEYMASVKEVLAGKTLEEAEAIEAELEELYDVDDKIATIIEKRIKKDNVSSDYTKSENLI